MNVTCSGVLGLAIHSDRPGDFTIDGDGVVREVELVGPMGGRYLAEQGADGTWYTHRLHGVARKRVTRSTRTAILKAIEAFDHKQRELLP